MALVRGSEIPTIDVALVTVTTKNAGGTVDKEYALDTASKIAVTPEIETQDAIKLMIKGALKAQKRKQSTLTGHTIVLTDNVFNPQVVQIFQGGTITYGVGDQAAVVTKYVPPLAGAVESDRGTVFELNAYSAIYNSAGIVTGYEKITYPNCKGEPISLSSEDNVFRVSEYTITSAPEVGTAPYELAYVTTLPTIS